MLTRMDCNGVAGVQARQVDGDGARRARVRQAIALEECWNALSVSKRHLLSGLAAPCER